MSLILIFTNDGTGPDTAANYHVQVAVNQRVIAHGRVEGHPRAESWRALVQRLLDQWPTDVVGGDTGEAEMKNGVG